MPDFKSKVQYGNSKSSSVINMDEYHIRRVVAGNPNTPQRVLERLADDQSPVVRRRIAENPRASHELLGRLAQDSHAEVRLAVAENASTPQEVLVVLAKDIDADVRYGVAENPHMPEAILMELSEDENPYIRCRAIKTLENLAPPIEPPLGSSGSNTGYRSSLGYQKG